MHSLEISYLQKRKIGPKCQTIKQERLRIDNKAVSRLTNCTDLSIKSKN